MDSISRRRSVLYASLNDNLKDRTIKTCSSENKFEWNGRHVKIIKDLFSSEQSCIQLASLSTFSTAPFSFVEEPPSKYRQRGNTLKYKSTEYSNKHRLRSGTELSQANQSLNGPDALQSVSDESLLPSVLILKKVNVNRSKSTAVYSELEFFKYISNYQCKRRAMTSQAREICNFIVDIFFVRETQNTLTFGLEFCPGGDLHGLIYNDNMSSIISNFCVFDMVLYLAEIASAIAFLHSLNIYHGDIKPTNIFISSSGHLKLGDFGESKFLPNLGLGKGITSKDYDEHNSIITCSGTLPYCAPEVLFRKPHRGEPDWWSFGVMACELLTGNTPFTALLEYSDEAAFEAICHGDMDSILNSMCFPCARAVCFVKSLLTRDMRGRLSETSFLETGADIFNNSFFECIDWDALLGKRYTPPFVPHLMSPDDTHYFEQGSEDNVVLNTGAECNTFIDTSRNNDNIASGEHAASSSCLVEQMKNLGCLSKSGITEGFNFSNQCSEGSNIPWNRPDQIDSKHLRAFLARESLSQQAENGCFQVPFNDFHKLNGHTSLYRLVA